MDENTLFPQVGEPTMHQEWEPTPASSWPFSLQYSAVPNPLLAFNFAPAEQRVRARNYHDRVEYWHRIWQQQMRSRQYDRMDGYHQHECAAIRAGFKATGQARREWLRKNRQQAALQPQQANGVWYEALRAIAGAPSGFPKVPYAWAMRALLKEGKDWIREALFVARTKDDHNLWVTPAFISRSWYSIPATTWHFVHMSATDPTKIAYAKDWRALYSLLDPGVTDESNKFTVTTVGKYLTKYFSESLSESEIRDIAAKTTQAAMPPTVLFAETGAEIIRVIAEGPTDSCMANGHYGNDRNDYSWFRGRVHPAAVYGSGDFVVAYIEDSSGRITSRMVINKKTKQGARAYGDVQKILSGIAPLGYTQAPRALIGCKIRRIEDRHGVIMAYIDAGTMSGGGALYAQQISDEFFVLTESTGINTYDGYGNRGVAEDVPQRSCDDCGDATDEDDLYYIDATDVSICESCRDDNYTYAYGRRSQDYYLNGDVICCDGEYYVERHASSHDIYQVDCGRRGGDWYHVDDLCSTDVGWAHCDDCVELDRTNRDHEWALESDTTETEDGEIILQSESFYCDINGTTHFEDDSIDVVSPSGQTRRICLAAITSDPEQFTVYFRIADAKPILLIGTPDEGFPITQWDFSKTKMWNVTFGEVDADDFYEALSEVYQEHHDELEAA